MRVFLSSTAVDLAEHRKALIDAILRRDWLPVNAERWGADPRPSLALCLDKLDEVEVVVVIVAWRYGTPVPVVEGGDGVHSYTWEELVRAEQKGLQVFGYIVDERAPWTPSKETDRLNQADADTAHIVARVGLLRELKDRVRTRSAGAFTTPDDLAAKVIADVGRWAAGRTEAATRPRQWPPCVVHSLQPAPAFAGREALMHRLTAWWADPAAPDRVQALVAPGGTGKTAVVERLVRTAGPVPGGGGLFVWSFYETPETEKFLQQAASYFSGKEVETRGALETLKAALRHPVPHMIVLDGLERVQAEGADRRVRGQLDDPPLRQLVTLLAAGDLGKARALVTTRFPLVDLDPWRDRGYHAEVLDDLEPAAAAAVLRQWGVRGDEATLRELGGRVGRHALSVAVLGSFLGKLCGGDPHRAAELDLDDAAAVDPASARLGRLLVYYRDRLGDDERQVMGWLSVVPRGLGVQVLRALTHDGRVAGVLLDVGDARLVSVLERLRGLGLLFAYGQGETVHWSAHPFLRDHFKVLLGVPREKVFAVVRDELGRGLDARPGQFPTEVDLLDRYEEWIEAAREAGNVEEAFDMYWFGLGSYSQLGKGNGEYARGRRILDGFASGVARGPAESVLREEVRAALASDWGAYRWALGDLDGALECLSRSKATFARLSDPTNESTSWRNTCDVHLSCGHLPAARHAGERALDLAEQVEDQRSRTYSHARLGAVLGFLGDVTAAREAFARAMSLEEPGFFSFRGVDEADLRLLWGDPEDARAQTEANLARCRSNGWGRSTALCRDLLGRAALPDDLPAARMHLAAVRDWSTRSGEVELVLRGHRLAAALALAAGDSQAALTEADAGIAVADALGYGLLAIDLRLIAARAFLSIPDPGAALKRARQALDASSHADCAYAWGEADAAHLAGLAHLALHEHELARRRLLRARELRAKLGHPDLAATERALAGLDGRPA